MFANELSLTSEKIANIPLYGTYRVVHRDEKWITRAGRILTEN